MQEFPENWILDQDFTYYVGLRFFNHRTSDVKCLNIMQDLVLGRIPIEDFTYSE